MKILDTAVLIDIDRGGKNIEKKAKKLDKEGKHVISTVSVTELYFGIEKKYQKETQRYKKAKTDLDKLLSRFKIKEINRSIAIHASKIMSNLKSRGLQLNDLHDIYIGATAKTEKLTVLTTNISHFERIQGVEVENWKNF